MNRPATSPRKLVFLSAGGTSVDVLGLINDINEHRHQYQPIGFLDDAESKQGQQLQGLPVLGKLRDADQFGDAYFVNCLGSPSNYWRRPDIVGQSGIAADRFETIVHPSAVVSANSELGIGTIVYPHVFIGSGVRIGTQALVMSNVSINHDVTIGDYSIVATSAILLGKVTLGEACYIGAGASIRQSLSVGDRSLVGMGSVVVRSVGPNCLVMGVPARFARAAVRDIP